jgi:putative ABC transport system permease protein
MRLGLTLHLLKGSLLHQRRRAALTLLTVAWGTLSMVFLLAFGEGARVRAEKEFQGWGAAFAMLHPGRTTKEWQGYPKGRQIQIWPRDIPVIQARLGADVLVSGWIGKGGVLLDHNGTTAVVNLRGVDSAFERLRNITPVEGSRFISPRDEEEKRRVIFLGDMLATELFGDEDPVGQPLLVAGQSYTVVGVLQHKLAQGLGGESPDTRVALVPRTTLLFQFGDRPLGVLVVMPPDPSKMEATLKTLRETLSSLYKLDPEDDQALPVWDRAKNAQEMRNTFTAILAFLAIIGGLTLFIGGVSVANIMFAIVKERTREIGVKMALGAHRRQITVPILMEGMLYTLSGGALGLAVSVVLVELMGAIPTEKYQGLSMMGHPTISWRIAFLTIATLALVGTLAGYFPARRAASINPAETLRYE